MFLIYLLNNSHYGLVYWQKTLVFLFSDVLGLFKNIWRIRFDTFMENSAPSNDWTYCVRWHRYFASLIETDVFEIWWILCMSFWPLHPVEREVLRKVSPALDLKILLDTKKGLDAVVKFLDSLPQLLCWWFAWLSSLLRFYWVSISGIELLGIMYLRFPLAHGDIHGEFGAIKCMNS